MYNKPLVPDSFEVPSGLQTKRMLLQPLTIAHAVKDFDAVMTSEERLRNVYDPEGDWPSGLNLEQNIVELGWHQTEFQLRTSFAYTVMSLNQAEVMGCVYIYPTSHSEHDAVITMWVRESRVEEKLDQHLFKTVKAWITKSWPLNKPAYPGRSISWKDWKASTKKKKEVG